MKLSKKQKEVIQRLKIIICWFKKHKFVYLMTAAAPRQPFSNSDADTYTVEKRCSRCGKSWEAKYIAGTDPISPENRQKFIKNFYGITK